MCLSCEINCFSNTKYKTIFQHHDFTWWSGDYLALCANFCFPNEFQVWSRFCYPRAIKEENESILDARNYYGFWVEHYWDVK